MTKNTLRCWDSSTVLAFADPRTITVIAIRESAGDTNNMSTIQTAPSKIKVPIKNQIYISAIRSIAIKDNSDTNILKANDAKSLRSKPALES